MAAEFIRCKEGRMNYADGSVYDGEWYLDKPFGKGTMKKADGTKIKSDKIQYERY